MERFEAFSLLFVDSFVSNLIIGFQRELIFHSMKVFGNYSYSIMFVVATCASLGGNIVNYIFGKCALNIFYSSKNEQNILRHKNLTQLFCKYELFILLLMAFPFWGSFISLFAGFFRTKFSKFLGLGCLAKACYYIAELYIIIAMKKLTSENSHRQQKVASIINEALIEILHRGKMLDPRLYDCPLTITKIIVTADLKIANCYFLPFNTKLTPQEITESLNNSKSAIRNFVTSKINMKYSPDIRFHYDHGFDNALKVEQLLKDTNNI